MTFSRYDGKVSFAALFEGTNTTARDPDTALGAVAQSQTPSEGGRESWESGGGSNTCTSLHTRAAFRSFLETVSAGPVCSDV